jgi:hypothetical protein
MCESTADQKGGNANVTGQHHAARGTDCRKIQQLVVAYGHLLDTRQLARKQRAAAER